MFSMIDSTIRRLPVYVLIDCSSSMRGDAIEAVDQAFKNLILKLVNDPHTSDVVWISVIVYNSVPRQLMPLCPISNFKTLPLKVGGSSNLGRALHFLSLCIKEEVRDQTMNQKGDRKPLVFLMSDGRSTDDWEGISEKVSRNVDFVACGVGTDVNVANLKHLTNIVVLMKDQTSDTFSQFIDFIGSAVTMASQKSLDSTEGITIDKKYHKIILS